MKIKVSTIPREGIKLEDTINLPALNLRMQEGEHNDIEFIEAPLLQILCKLERDDYRSGVSVTGKITSRYIQPCPRCLKPTEHSLEQPIDLTFKRRSTNPDRPAMEDDIGLVLFDGEQIEFEEIAQEALILGVSPFGVSHANCPGIPQELKETAAPTSKSTSLGELLRDAGVTTDKKNSKN